MPMSDENNSDQNNERTTSGTNDGGAQAVAAQQSPPVVELRSRGRPKKKRVLGPGKSKGGRKKGGKNKITIARDAAIAMADAGMELPHQFLMRVAIGGRVLVGFDESTTPHTGIYEYPSLDQRIEAARAAAPYFAPRLSTVELVQAISDDDLRNYITSLKAVDAGLFALIAGIADAAGIGLGDGRTSTPCTIEGNQQSTGPGQSDDEQRRLAGDGLEQSIQRPDASGPL